MGNTKIQVLKWKDWRKVIYTSHYDSWPMINLCPIEKPKTDISFILEKVHQEKEHIYINVTIWLSLEMLTYI